MITFTLPIKPVAWQRVKRSERGIAYVPTETRRFKREAAWLARGAMVGGPMHLPLRVDLRFVLDRPKSVKRKHPAVRPDLDNFVKAVKDALNGVAWADDSLICELHAEKVYAASGPPHIEVTIFPLVDGPEVSA